jgi:hypothetical protein
MVLLMMMVFPFLVFPLFLFAARHPTGNGCRVVVFAHPALGVTICKVLKQVIWKVK